ncbi:unnamed protein product [Adineta steineri]|uniref:Uncharacterized protein n=1 Tax=Adineta steineri TaxID=433720 RepID=A0A813M8T3_9BILA|nr:unnamed protein product [Adineta steineri]CAF1213349.1 unnamed protein product [Adineta steineri]CAF1240385.1 unnamed protein product [Adineta steineri]CAF3577117.1 unnamed protein product [Adineta steineri]CAF3985857.1 unnamed protein product [Adineta steineri]
MDFRALKSKLTGKSLSEINLATLSVNTLDNRQNCDIEKLQNEIEIKQKTLDVSIRHMLITLDANIDDFRLTIDQKRTKSKIPKLSVCDLWLRLKTIEQLQPYPLVTFLRTNQLYRSEIKFTGINNDCYENEQDFSFNSRRCRFTHFHICVGSDEFNFNDGSYVGLVVFSYDNLSKFILNKHHSQRGDIIIKHMKTFTHAQISQRGIYDALFKLYFNCSIDEKFIGIGFLYSNRKWHFDLIAYDHRELYPYEYRVFDLYLFTHWLTKFTVPHNVQEMEIYAKDLVLKQCDVVRKKLIEEDNTDLSNMWMDFIGSDAKDLQIAINQFIQTAEKESESIFKEIVRKKRVLNNN